MRLIASLTLGAILASSVFAAPPAKPIPSQVIIYDSPNFEGENISLPPDGTCYSIFPWISSVYVPGGEYIYCQLFDNDACSGEGGDVIVESVREFAVDAVYPGIICGVLSE